MGLYIFFASHILQVFSGLLLQPQAEGESSRRGWVWGHRYFKLCQCSVHAKQLFTPQFTFLELWEKKILGKKSWRTSFFPTRKEDRGTQKREIAKKMPLNRTCPILLSGYCSVPVLSADLKLWSATRYNLLIIKQKGLLYSSFKPARLIWNSNNVVISLSEVYFKVADMFSNDRPSTYFLSLISIYLQLI